MLIDLGCGREDWSELRWRSPQDGRTHELKVERVESGRRMTGCFTSLLLVPGETSQDKAESGGRVTSDTYGGVEWTDVVGNAISCAGARCEGEMLYEMVHCKHGLCKIDKVKVEPVLRNASDGCLLSRLWKEGASKASGASVYIRQGQAVAVSGTECTRPQRTCICISICICIRWPATKV